MQLIALWCNVSLLIQHDLCANTIDYKLNF